MTLPPVSAVPDPHAANVRHVLRALRANRTPGWHLPAHFLELRYDGIASEEARVGMPVGPHCVDRQGAVHRAALMVLADVAMAGALRIRFGTTVRLATVTARLDLATTRAAQHLHAAATCRLDISDAAVPLTVCSVEVRAGDDLLCSGEATFVVLANNRATAPHPLPRSSTLQDLEPLDIDDLSAEERDVLGVARRAATDQAPDASFLDAFWGLAPKVGDGWAECAFERGTHVCNRVGDVQGGVLMGLAAQTAAAVLGEAWQLVDVSARYLAAADSGRLLLARAEIVRTGRTIAFVECRVTDESQRVALRAEATLARRAGTA